MIINERNMEELVQIVATQTERLRKTEQILKSIVYELKTQIRKEKIKKIYEEN